MRSDEIVEENKHHDHGIGAFERVKPVSGFVPVFELLVECFDNIV